MRRAMRHWSPAAGINGEFKNGGKMHLIAQLLDGAMRSLRSMNTAQPWVRGKNEWMFMELLVQTVHVLDVYIAVCSMQWSTTWLLPFNEKKEI